MPQRTAIPARRRELGCIHLLAKQLGLDDAGYRNVLWAVARVDSAADLDSHGRRDVIEHLRSRLPAQSANDRYGLRPRTVGQRPLLRKIEALLTDAHRPWQYAEALARRLAHKDKLEFCSDAELGKIVAALIYDAQRHGRN